MRTGIIGWILPAIFLAGSAVGQTGDWAKTVAAAKKEGLVQFYISMTPQAADRIIAGFRKVYPEIEVAPTRASTGVIMSRIDQERKTGAEGGDMWVGAEEQWFVARAKEGTLLKPAGPALKGWPAFAILEGAVIVPSRDPMVIMYNKKLVKDAPRSYVDLLRPEYKGRLSATEIPSVTQLAWYVWLEQTQDPDYWTKLKAQNVRIYVGGPQSANGLAAGETAAVVGASTIAVIKPLMDQGAPVDFTLPNPAFGLHYYMGVFNWGKRPNASLVLMDYIMSPEGQANWHGTGESASPRSGIQGSLNWPTITPFNAQAYPPEVAKKHIDRWNAMFK